MKRVGQRGRLRRLAAGPSQLGSYPYITDIIGGSGKAWQGHAERQVQWLVGVLAPADDVWLCAGRVCAQAIKGGANGERPAVVD